MKYLTCFALAALCCAELSAPLIGYVRTAAQELRPVYGVSGAFQLGEPIQRLVLTASFTSSAGLVKTASEILVYRGAKTVASYPASFGFTTGGEPSWVRFENASCATFGKDGLHSAPCPPESNTVEQVADDWHAVHTEEFVYLTRNSTGQSWRLPEAVQ
jgi:hypothetical protein